MSLKNSLYTKIISLILVVAILMTSNDVAFASQRPVAQKNDALSAVSRVKPIVSIEEDESGNLKVLPDEKRIEKFSSNCQESAKIVCLKRLVAEALYLELDTDGLCDLIERGIPQLSPAEKEFYKKVQKKADGCFYVPFLTDTTGNIEIYRFFKVDADTAISGDISIIMLDKERKVGIQKVSDERNGKKANDVTAPLASFAGRDRVTNLTATLNGKVNQDSVYADPRGRFIIAADGVGGNARGDIASSTAVKTIAEILDRELSKVKDLSAAKGLFYGAIKEAIKAIEEKIAFSPAIQNTSTTLSLAVKARRSDGKYVVVGANVGDSRVYLRRKDGTVVQISKDDSRVQEYVDKGLITKEEAEIHSQRNIITRGVGSEKIRGAFSLEAHQFFAVEVEEGDIVFVVTDGVTDNLSAKALSDLVSKSSGLQEVVWNLVNESSRIAYSPVSSLSASERRRKKPDDITVAAMEIGGKAASGQKTQTDKMALKVPGFLPEEELAKRLASVDASSWHNRTVAIDLGNGYVQALKFRKFDEKKETLEYEARMMKELREKGFGVPLSDGRGVLRFKGSLTNAPAGLALAKEYITYITTTQYFTYPEEIKNAEAMKRCALRAIREVAVLNEEGYLHKSLAPLTHHTRSGRSWFWNYEPIGGVENMTEDLRYSNIRASGLADFAHVEKIGSSDFLYYEVGRELMEWALVISYNSLQNGLDSDSVADILQEGLSEYLKQMGIPEEEQNVSLTELKEFVKLFRKGLRVKSVGYLEGIPSRNDGGLNTIEQIRDVVKDMLVVLEKRSAPYKRMKERTFVQDLAAEVRLYPSVMLKDGDILYAADKLKGCITRVDTRDGSVKDIALKSFTSVAGMIKEEDDIYLTDDKKKCVIKINVKDGSSEEIGLGEALGPKELYKCGDLLYVLDRNVDRRCLVSVNLRDRTVKTHMNGVFESTTPVIRDKNVLYAGSRERKSILRFDLRTWEYSEFAKDIVAYPMRMITQGDTLYVADGGKQGIVEINMTSGRAREMVSGKIRLAGELIYDQGYLYFSAPFNGSIMRVNVTDGSFVELAKGKIGKPWGVMMCGDSLYAFGGERGSLMRISPRDGEVQEMAKGAIFSPWSAIRSNDDLYIADGRRRCIVRVKLPEEKSLKIVDHKPRVNAATRQVHKYREDEDAATPWIEELKEVDPSGYSGILSDKEKILLIGTGKNMLELRAFLKAFPGSHIDVVDVNAAWLGQLRRKILDDPYMASQTERIWLHYADGSDLKDFNDDEYGIVYADGIDESVFGGREILPYHIMMLQGIVTQGLRVLKDGGYLYRKGMFNDSKEILMPMIESGELSMLPETDDPEGEDMVFVKKENTSALAGIGSGSSEPFKWFFTNGGKPADSGSRFRNVMFIAGGFTVLMAVLSPLIEAYSRSDRASRVLLLALPIFLGVTVEMVDDFVAQYLSDRKNSSKKQTFVMTPLLGVFAWGSYGYLVGVVNWVVNWIRFGSKITEVGTKSCLLVGVSIFYAVVYTFIPYLTADKEELSSYSLREQFKKIYYLFLPGGLALIYFATNLVFYGLEEYGIISAITFMVLLQARAIPSDIYTYTVMNAKEGTASLWGFMLFVRAKIALAAVNTAKGFGLTGAMVREFIKKCYLSIPRYTNDMDNLNGHLYGGDLIDRFSEPVATEAYNGLKRLLGLPVLSPAMIPVSRGQIAFGDAKELAARMERSSRIVPMPFPHDVIISLRANIGERLKKQPDLEKKLLDIMDDTAMRASFREFDAVILPRRSDGVPSGWLLGFNTLNMKPRPPTAVSAQDADETEIQKILREKYPDTIAFSYQVIREIMFRSDNELLLKEYYFHEIFCPHIGHERTRELQEKIFSENYIGFDAENLSKAPGHKDGLLSDVLRKVVNDFAPEKEMNRPVDGPKIKDLMKKVSWVKAKEVKNEPSADAEEICMLGGNIGTLTEVRTVKYKGKEYIAKMVGKIGSEYEYIDQQAVILQYLKEQGVKGISLPVYFLDVDMGNRSKKAILFEVFPKGETLHKNFMRRSGRWDARSARSALEVTLKVARIVEELHEKNVYHWDIKPGNIWLANNGEVILFDFDLAFFSNDFGSFSDRGLGVKGTPRFMSPFRKLNSEDGFRPPVPADEVFALGVIFARMIGLPDDISSNITKLEEICSVLRKDGYPIPAAVRDILLKCFEMKYQSVHEFVLDVESLDEPDIETADLPILDDQKIASAITKTGPGYVPRTLSDESMEGGLLSASGDEEMLLTLEILLEHNTFEQDKRTMKIITPLRLITQGVALFEGTTRASFARYISDINVNRAQKGWKTFALTAPEDADMNIKGDIGIGIKKEDKKIVDMSTAAPKGDDIDRKMELLKRVYVERYGESLRVLEPAEKGMFAPSPFEGTRKILEEIGVPGKISFLDMGSGDGLVLFMARIMMADPAAKVVGIELDKKFSSRFRVLQKALIDAGLTEMNDITIINADYMDFSRYDISSFDAIYKYDSTGDTEDEKAILEEELSARMKPGAIFVNRVIGREMKIKGSTKMEIRSLLDKTRYSVLVKEPGIKGNISQRDETYSGAVAVPGDFARWSFDSGMEFGDMNEWWGQTNVRNVWHEGVDYYSYETTMGEKRTLSPGAGVRVLFDGEIVNVIRDLIGSSVFVKHDVFDGTGKQLYTVYGHVSPDDGMAPGKALDKHEKMAVLARPAANVSAPAHLHLSIFWAPRDLDPKDLNWGNVHKLGLVDPETMTYDGAEHLTITEYGQRDTKAVRDVRGNNLDEDPGQILNKLKREAPESYSALREKNGRILLIGPSDNEKELRWFLREFPNARIDVVDVSEQWLEGLRKKIIQDGYMRTQVGRMTLHRADATRLPVSFFGSDQYDLVFSSGIEESVFVADRVKEYHWEMLKGIVSEGLRVLKPGGYLYREEMFLDPDNVLVQMVNDGRLRMLPYVEKPRMFDSIFVQKTEMLEQNNADESAFAGTPVPILGNTIIRGSVFEKVPVKWIETMEDMDDLPGHDYIAAFAFSADATLFYYKHGDDEHLKGIIACDKTHHAEILIKQSMRGVKFPVVFGVKGAKYDIKDGDIVKMYANHPQNATIEVFKAVSSEGGTVLKGVSPDKDIERDTNIIAGEAEWGKRLINAITVRAFEMAGANNYRNEVLMLGLETDKWIPEGNRAGLIYPEKIKAFARMLEKRLNKLGLNNVKIVAEKSDQLAAKMLSVKESLKGEFIVKDENIIIFGSIETLDSKEFAPFKDAFLAGFDPDTLKAEKPGDLKLHYLRIAEILTMLVEVSPYVDGAKKLLKKKASLTSREISRLDEFKKKIAEYKGISVDLENKGLLKKGIILIIPNAELKDVKILKKIYDAQLRAAIAA